MMMMITTTTTTTTRISRHSLTGILDPRGRKQQKAEKIA
jgi:hypothetical protein